MKHFLPLILCFFIATNLFAQDNIPYAEKALQIQKDIWGSPTPEFKATAVPAALAKESAVILARSFSLQRTSGRKVKFMMVASHTLKLTSFHERVKINDKAALESFSSLEYQKKLDKTTSITFSKLVNIKNTYIGAKVIKPDGKEVVVNTSEEALLKNEEKDQKGKLAISDLQVGDILDYYISVVDVSESFDNNSFKANDNLILLADEYPVMHYNLDFQFNKKLDVKCIYANGAPHFDESHNDEGDYLLSVKLKDIPKYESQLWTSPLRQYPYIEIGSSYLGKYSTYVGGDYEKDPNASRFENNKTGFEESFQEYPFWDKIEKNLKDYFGSKKNLKSAPLDSIMKVLYDEWKFDVFCSYSGKELDDVSGMNYRSALSQHATALISMILTDMEIDHDVLLVASRNSNTLENVFNSDDMDALIRINGTTPMYMSFGDIVTHFNEIPARFQGEKALVLHPKRHNAMRYSFTENETILPVATNDKNRIEEQLQVSLLSANMQKLKITRLTRAQGELRHDDQKQLIPVADVDEGFRSMVNGDELAKRLKKSTDTKKMIDDYTFSFNKEKTEMSKNFTAEIKDQYDQDPEQVQDFKIVNPALEQTAPVFEYSSSFVLNNLVKKAGPNYIIDAGKLTGGFYKLEDKERKRTVDVYMPCARSFKYTITLAIPQGYGAKGMEEMNISKTNKTGSFTSVAAVHGNNLTITVTRVYNNNFEKIANWALLTDMIDAASDFNTKKILLEKKG